MKNPATEQSSVYDLRTNWPPYTYRDYPDIKPETYKAFLEFLDTENTSKRLMELQPWVSICDSRCSFCYFPTTATSKARIEPYLVALKKELDMYAKTRYLQTSVFDEIVLGGGTPSVLSAEQIIDLIEYCKARFTVTDDCFIKVTGSSKSFDRHKIIKLAEYGAFQMDMGAQTFDNNLRKAFCLPDPAEQVEEAIKLARKLDMCVCVDILYNLPGQTMEAWVDTLKKCIELDVEVDVYALEVVPDTILDMQIKAGKMPPPGDVEHETQMYLTAYKMLTDAGYKAVGHDRFSREPWHFKESCLNGWPFAAQLTTGAGCFMGYFETFSYSNIEDINQYMDAVNAGRLPINKISESTPEEMMRKVMTRLYLRLPVDKIEFKEKFGKNPEDVFSPQLTRLVEKGLLTIDEKEIKITKLGDIWKGNIAWEFADNPRAKNMLK
ncbi:MAG: coproporphyrinogen III oxidase family protein [Candidatus Bathyarchaeota archaeon]|nr:coproporphyrinogen III oxidase family protein [Candidatus Termiticorpusculum sp.]